MKIEIFSEVQQDTLMMQQRQNQSVQDITVQKPQLDLDRAEEIMRLFEQREQEMIVSQDSVATPKSNAPVRKPFVAVDTLPLRDSVQITLPVVATTGTPATDTGFACDTKQVGYPSSITLFIICGLILLTVIRYHFGKNMAEAFQSFFRYRHASRMFEERRETDRQAALLSNILFVWITGIYISIALPFFGASPLWENYVLSILFFSAATGLLYLVKAWIWNVLGVIFAMQTFSKIYAYNMFLYNRNIGLMIFPLVAVIPFVTKIISIYFVFSVIAVFVLSYLFKLWRIFQIIHTRNISVIYFILYLCTLEILPLLLLIKGCKILIESVIM